MEPVGYLKFFVKIRIVGPLRSFFLLTLGAKVNADGWDKRMLIVNFEALGDLVVFTSVLKHYKRRFPDKKIYLLVKSGLGIEAVFKRGFVDEVILLEYRRFAANPFYGARLINGLRRIGFGQVINHDFSVAEPFGKIIAVGVGAKEVAGYEGMGLEYRIPFDLQQKKTIFYVVNKIFPRYTKLIPRIDRGMPEDGVLPSAINHYIAIYEGATGFRESDYRTALALDGGGLRPLESFLRKRGLSLRKYVVVNFGASVFYKRWPAGRFAETLNSFEDLNMPIVLTGSLKERPLAQEFIGVYKGTTIDLIGKTSFADFLGVARGAFFVFTNDSSTAHIAVAEGTPSLCVSGGGQFGMFQDYGVPEINRWVYKKSPCYGDNWRCGKGAGGKLSPCVEAIGVLDAKNELASLLEYLKRGGSKSAFRLGRPAPAEPRGYKLKIIYAGIESENYDPRRRPSFEYGNFYLSLKAFPGAMVIEYPYEPIVTVGKKKFNEDLLRLVRREKPDLFFAFMFTDELDARALDEIKQLTKSVAWFADDHWRIWNYSRHYAPHFSWVVTTWSKAPEIYARWGVKNVIRSEWACNTRLSRPADLPRDINVSFVGQRNSFREKIVKALRKAGVRVRVRGLGWPEGRLSEEDVARSFARTKINLNFNTSPPRWSPKMLGRLFFRRSRDRIVPDFWNIKDNFISWRHMKIPQIKARPFEIVGCGAFLISACADDMAEYYEDGKEVVYYDGTTADLVQKIKHYLAHGDERERIARAGYERTVREHTYEKRFGDLFKTIGLGL